MKNIKKDYYNKEILQVLLNEELSSIKEIAHIIGLSEKSVRNKIYDINTFLKANDLGEIQKKPRVGIWLVSTENQKQKIENFLMRSNSVAIKDDEKERKREVLKLLFKLYPWETVTTQKLAEELYLSAPTILKILKDCENDLKSYSIRIVNERNRGYRLEHRENEYRRALKEFIMEDRDIVQIKKNMDFFFYNIDTNLIQKSIIKVENEWNYQFTDESFYEIFIYCCIAYQRKDIQRPIVKGTDKTELLQKYNEYRFAQAIFEQIQKQFHVLFTYEDIQFLSIQIMCTYFIGIYSDEILEQVKLYENKLIEFVDKSIEVVGNILDVDFSQDQKLKESLILHLRPTIFRLRYGNPQKNSLIHFIKNEYKNVFRAMLSISIMFEEYYGLQLTEDEVGYLVLYVQSALERQKRMIHFLLITDLSRGYAQLLAGRMRKMIPEMSDIEVMSAHDFQLYGNSHADIIISTKELPVIDSRLLVIPNLLSESGIVYLRSKLDAMLVDSKKNISFSSTCIPLFDPELIFVHPSVKEKEELLKLMAQGMEGKGYVTNRFFESVMEREKATTTSIGNGISLPHGAQSTVLEPKVSIAILDTPIAWDDDQVDVVFLLGVKMMNSDEAARVQTFYKEYISLIEEEDNIKKLKNLKTNLEVYKFLIQ